jgi:transcription initiation factor TFIIE subunit alpha
MRDNGFAKAQQRSYYYLDYSKATDVVKWRMWRIQQTIDVKLRNVSSLLARVCGVRTVSN